jgi:hypothetical protein
VVKIFFLLIGICFASSSALAEPTLFDDFAGGIELAGVPTLLVTDGAVGAFGFGLGHNIGLFAVTKRTEGFGLKARIDRYYSRQEALSRSDMSDVASRTFLKALTQQYTIISAGAEWRWKETNHQYFSEALLGYALGVRGKIELVNQDGSLAGGELASKDVPLKSLFSIMGGVGYRRNLKNRWTLQAGLRTFFVLGSPYDKDLDTKTIVPVPLLLHLGVMY